MERKEDLSSWEDLEKKIKSLRDDSFKLDKGESLIGGELLFRGQGDHEWSLQATFDRTGKDWSLIEYFRLLLKVRSQVQTFTGQRWNLGKFEDFNELECWCKDYDSLHNPGFPGYDYLVFLRHHGFPSPLLDWTRSLYIAAFFAFIQPKSDRVAIYVYKEHDGYKVHSSDEPQILSFGPFVTSHPRHYIQQSQYTIAAQFNGTEGIWRYVGHEEIFNLDVKGQDFLWKFTLPTSERTKVLKILDEFNLNEFTLFQSDEALLRTIAVRELEL